VIQDDTLHAAVGELEDYREGVDEPRAAELVLPFASRWVLPEVGLDLARLRAEAETLVRATPLSDRIVSGYVDHVAYWVSQRMLVDGEREPKLALARVRLRGFAADLEDSDFARVAAGVRATAALDDEALWTALATRIAETVLP
jgi:hypothetical protein